MMVTARILKILLVVLAICGFSCLKMMAYNQEFQQLRHYFEEIIPAVIPRCNLTDYNIDLHSCHNNPSSMKCQKIVTNVYHAKNCKLWFRQKELHPKPDCEYEIRFIGASFSRVSVAKLSSDDIGYATFSFHIHQHLCKMSSLPFGGSTFDAFGYTDGSIAICSVLDNFNNTYHLSCRAPIVNPTLRMCLYLTVMLEHEHYDAYSLVLTAWTNTYPSYRKVLLDNVSFCAEHVVMNVAHSLQQKDTPIAVPPGIPVFAGVWIREQQKQQQSHSPNCNISFADSIEMDNNFVSTDAPREPSSNLLMNSLSLWKYQRGCFMETAAHKKLVQSEMTPSDGAPAITLDTNLPNDFTFRPLKFENGTTMKPQYDVPKLSLSKLKRDDQKVHYFFLGASHLRYSFFAAYDLLHGHNSTEHIDRKADHVDLGHFHFRFAGSAADQLRFIESVCGVLPITAGAFRNTSFGGDKTVLVVQSGDWDLTLGISMVVKDGVFGGPPLMKLLRSILSSSNAQFCPRIEEIVFLTAMPYPVCFTDNTLCVEHRCFRTNTAVAAMNTYFLTSLLDPAIHYHLSRRFRVVDAFSITLPRLGMNENHEIACKNHFACSVELWTPACNLVGKVVVNEVTGLEELSTLTNKNCTRRVMTYAPGGMAVVQSILHALSL